MRLPQKCFEEYVSLAAPAKVNLRLCLTGRRGDGYHLLSMVNDTCSLMDSVRIRLTEKPGVSVEMKCDELPRQPVTPVPAAADNLVSRAILAYVREFSLEFGAEVKIDKRIPFGAGLGGGSGDAAAVLRYLARQSEVPASDVRLQRIAISLGADVPYMLYGGLARLGGIGEEVIPLDSSQISGATIALIFPDFEIPSAKIFAEARKLDLTYFQPDHYCDEVMAAARSAGVLTREMVVGLIRNDLSPLAASCFPASMDVAARLGQEASWVHSMTGSGSTDFVFPRREMSGVDLLAELQKRLAGLPVTVRLATLD